MIFKKIKRVSAKDYDELEILFKLQRQSIDNVKESLFDFIKDDTSNNIGVITAFACHIEKDKTYRICYQILPIIRFNRYTMTNITQHEMTGIILNMPICQEMIISNPSEYESTGDKLEYKLYTYLFNNIINDDEYSLYESLSSDNCETYISKLNTFLKYKEGNEVKYNNQMYFECPQNNIQDKFIIHHCIHSQTYEFDIDDLLLLSSKDDIMLRITKPSPHNTYNETTVSIKAFKYYE